MKKTFDSFSFGHSSIKLQKSWNNDLHELFLGTRNKTIIFNFEYTFKHLIKAVSVFIAVIKSKGSVFIVNTNPELSKLVYHVKKNAHSPYLFYSDCGWTNGTLTNWAKVSNKVQTFLSFYHDFDYFLMSNNIHFPKYKKMKKNYKGFTPCFSGLPFALQSKKSNGKLVSADLETQKDFKSLFPNSKPNTQWKPDVIILLSTLNTQSIIKEAYKLNIPIIALVDSNSNVSKITYPIPTNTYSYSFVCFFCTLITKLINKHYFL